MQKHQIWYCEFVSYTVKKDSNFQNLHQVVVRKMKAWDFINLWAFIYFSNDGNEEEGKENTFQTSVKLDSNNERTQAYLQVQELRKIDAMHQYVTFKFQLVVLTFLFPPLCVCALCLPSQFFFYFFFFFLFN